MNKDGVSLRRWKEVGARVQLEREEDMVPLARTSQAGGGKEVEPSGPSSTTNKYEGGSQAAGGGAWRRSTGMTGKLFCR